jgi:RNA polymerase sigma-70 factor (ECF subfamily)
VHDASDDHRRRYLYTVATNLVRRHRRTEAAAGNQEEPVTNDLDAAERVAVQQALGTMPAVERQALWLTYVEGWSSRELARMLGYREGSMRQVISRARRRFAEAFDHKAEEDDRDS